MRCLGENRIKPERDDKTEKPEVRLYDIANSTTLESNKSLAAKVEMAIEQGDTLTTQP